MVAEPTADPDIKPEPDQSHLYSDAHLYHPDVPDNDYFPGSSGGGYHYGFDIFGLYPPQYNTPSPYPQQYTTLGPYPPQYNTPGLYPLQYTTLSSSSSSMPFEPYFSTPPPGPEEDVGRRKHPQHERQPPQRYTYHQAINFKGFLRF
ncbi:hypothetical protein J1N35_009920 [Gossypium stocksii]|uniref:Uncharacterized protein n=1 Tax=Gossypium stocksii TaxID=47602 RepID=A0A9D4AA12_9ROSI|nr:hypothetical protein J1N35_009920 [Gossypium stocksii]